MHARGPRPVREDSPTRAGGICIVALESTSRIPVTEDLALDVIVEDRGARLSVVDLREYANADDDTTIDLGEEQLAALRVALASSCEDGAPAVCDGCGEGAVAVSEVEIPLGPRSRAHAWLCDDCLGWARFGGQDPLCFLAGLTGRTLAPSPAA